MYTASLIRRMLKSLSRGVVLKRHLPQEFSKASLFVSPESTLAFWRRDIAKVDPFLLSMVQELVHPGMIVWDIGANVGLFAFAAATRGATVLAVEPDIWLTTLMNRSVRLNSLPVTVVPGAVAEHVGVSKLHLSDNGRASNSLSGAGPVQTVITVTLDWLLEHFSAPHVLKIDVEGAEYAVLKGGAKVLQSRPIVFCEVTENHELVGNLLRSADYDLFAARERERQPLRRPSRDTLAIPHAINYRS